SARLGSREFCVGLECADQRRHVLWWRHFPLERLASQRVLECESRCVQRLALERVELGNQRLAGTPRNTSTSAVDRIANQRMSDVREMHPYLVSATGFELRSHQRVSAKSLQHPVMGHGLAAVTAHSHACSLRPVPTDGLIYRSAT